MVDPALVPGVESPPVEVAERSVLLRRLLLFGTVALTLILLILGIFYGPTFWRVYQQGGATFSAPAKIGGLQLDDSEGAKDTAEYIRAAAGTEVDFDRSLGAVYTDSAADARTVIVVGGTARLWAPEPALDKMFSMITDDTGGVATVRDVDAGPLGGYMRCGTTATADGEMAVCGWADHGCIAVALFPNRSQDEAADLIRQMRTAMQKRR